MRERHQFIAEYLSDIYTVTELCARFGISRKTAYKWIARYAEVGFDGLHEHSRATQSCPHRTPAAVRGLYAGAAGQQRRLFSLSAPTNLH
jgi:putative transposase